MKDANAWGFVATVLMVVAFVSLTFLNDPDLALVSAVVAVAAAILSHHE